jgi:hypothetical protein
MDKYSTLANLSDSSFRRLTGVTRTVFEKMLSVYTEALQKSYKRQGRPSKLSNADKILMMLEYNREYRTYFHIGQSYGLAEGNVYKSIKQVENLLIKSGQFSLPKRSSLLKDSVEYEVVIIDVTETKIERPKKNKKNIIAKRNTIII